MPDAAPRELVRHPGNEELFRALAWSVEGVRLGWPLHVHVEGVRGTGKTTIVRHFRDRLPLIRRIRGCVYQCDPEAPHCPEHRGLPREAIRALGEEWVRAPFLEVSASAKIGTLVGSLDLAGAVGAGRAQVRILPGTLAQAHRGVVFVDEINRLADIAPEVADALLDVMGTKPGRLQIEETGLPRVVLPLRVTVWAASNPDEEPGPLADVRRQLADRFDLCVAMQRPTSVEVVRRILWLAPPRPAPEPERLAAPRPASEPGGLDAPVADPEAPSREAPTEPAADGPAWPEEDEAVRDFLAAAYVRFQLESLRSVEAWQQAAWLSALSRRSPRVAGEDLLAAAAPALRHRVEPEALSEILAHARERLLPGPAREEAAGAVVAGGEPLAPETGGVGAGPRPGAAHGGATADRPDPAGATEERSAREGGRSAAPPGRAALGDALELGAHPDDGLPPWSRLFARVRGTFAQAGRAGWGGTGGPGPSAPGAPAVPGARRAGAFRAAQGLDRFVGDSRDLPGDEDPGAGGAGAIPGGDGAGLVAPGGGLGAGSAAPGPAGRGRPGAGAPGEGVGPARLADPRDVTIRAPVTPARRLADLGASPLWRE